MYKKIVLLLCVVALAGCEDHAWNDPYPNEPADANILYTEFSEQPKHLDPARSYSGPEWDLIGNIYEPPLDYDYIKRPYELIGVTAESIPIPSYDPITNISTYRIKIKPGIQFQPHPAFAKQNDGEYYYHNLTSAAASKFRTISDFPHTGSRELKAADYVYQLKRLADPRVNSVIFGYFTPYILGLSELRAELTEVYANKYKDPNIEKHEIDLRPYNLEGVQVIDDYTYDIKIKGKYPQFKYWLAMPMFAPMPWEATQFYAQPGFAKSNITLDVWPIGTGAYYLAENNPQRRMLLTRNPNFHPDFYPSDGEPQYAGMRLPFIDQVVYSLEKEDIPSWDKFLQGYYDRSGISANNFSNVISSISRNNYSLTQPMIDKGISLRVANIPLVSYWGFNMLDPLVGGYTERARNLRHAIGLAFDIEEYIAIFANGRGTPANGPIPHDIYGYEPYTPEPEAVRLVKAKQLLAAAGYPDGRDRVTGKQLQINYDIMTDGDPSAKATFAWMQKQMAKIGVDLLIRASDFNRFQDKMHNGTAQLFGFAWNADYPDPENFLFLFYGPNGEVKYNGQNAANYSNPEYDRLFEEFKSMGDDPARIILINQMVEILRKDAPWIWGVFPQGFGLYHQWNKVGKPNLMTKNTLKYAKIDPEMRAKLRVAWNKPILWPFVLFVLIILICIVPAYIGYRQSENRSGLRKN